MENESREGVTLEILRERINGVDRELMELISKRIQIALEIGKLKNKEGLPVRDEAREEEVIKQWESFATVLSIDPAFIRPIVEALIQASRLSQENQKYE